MYWNIFFKCIEIDNLKNDFKLKYLISYVIVLPFSIMLHIIHFDYILIWILNIYIYNDAYILSQINVHYIINVPIIHKKQLSKLVIKYEFNFRVLIILTSINSCILFSPSVRTRACVCICVCECESPSSIVYL